MKGQDVPEDQSTTRILKKRTVLQLTTTTSFSPPKGVSVQSARVELVKGTLQLITTIEIDVSEDSSALDVTRVLRDLWTTSNYFGVQSGT